MRRRAPWRLPQSALPNYEVFDEARNFAPGSEPGAVWRIGGAVAGVCVCEDLWSGDGPPEAQAAAGAQILLVPNASPFHREKPDGRRALAASVARRTGLPVVYVNCVGGQDELVFDGHSVVIDQEGRILARAPQFEESLTLATVDPGAVDAARLKDARHRTAVRRTRAVGAPASPPVRTLARLDRPPTDTGPTGAGSVAEVMGPEEEVYTALVTGVRDYVEKNGFTRTVIGLSGGIDSALVALVAADALGPGRLVCAVMPSRYSSEATQGDARAIAANLGAELHDIDITGPMKAFDAVLVGAFAGREPDLAEENLQARIRGNLVMALSNKFGWLVLTTGNKSELSVGYATLYGDMAGGFAVLKDVFKNWVYRLVRWRNEREGRELVPASVIDRPPSAELREEQRDEDSLPPYDVLDAILAGYVEGDLDSAALQRQGLPADEVERVIRMVDRAEYKRRQAPPGIRISSKAFGRDRRLPITNRFGA